ncbi:MAG: glycosyltransferase [Candidatus Thermoplasmatota archaeon]|jgi:glycosyltransferase involved in cell wall biosynthesis|nr:glycosyltransferase [Candidatus Thermoplasmatota archaeon]
MKIVMLAPFGISKGTVLSRILPLGHALAGRDNDVEIVIPQEKSSMKVPICSGSLSLINILTGSPKMAIDDLRASYQMMRTASALDPDLIHVFKPKGYSGLAGMLIRAGEKLGNEKIPLVLDGDDYEGFGGMNDVMNYPLTWNFFFHFQERFLPRISDRMTLASTYLMDYYSSFGAERENMTHLPNGVNPFIHCPETIEKELMEFLTKRIINSEVRTAPEKEGVFTGTNEEIGDYVPEETISLFTRFRDHSHARVLNIFRSIQKENSKVKFLLSGGGEEGESLYLQKGMKKYLKRGSFFFTGTFPFSSLYEIFSYSNIAMVPMDDSNITRAKCSAKLVDLMAMGKAVVADNVGENGNYIEDGVSGYLVHNIVHGSIGEINKVSPQGKDLETKNTKEFTERLVYLLDNPTEANKLRQEARTRIKSKFSWSGLAGKVVDLYGELV